MQIPDASQFLKLGFVGAVLLCAYLALLIAYKVIANNLTGGSGKSGGPRELSAGEKSADYWESVFSDIRDDGNRELLAAMEKDHRAVMEMLGKLRARLRDSNQSATAALTEVKEFRQQYRQDMISLVRLLRDLEQKLDGH